jgi:hypothetical protein
VPAGRIDPELAHFSVRRHFKQAIDARAGFCRDRQIIVSPPHSSLTRLYTVSCCFILSDSRRYIHFIDSDDDRNDRGLLGFYDSTVCGMMPSSAATTRMAISVIPGAAGAWM